MWIYELLSTFAGTKVFVMAHFVFPQRFLCSLVLCVGSLVASAQCINMTDLDAPGTACGVANHEYHSYYDEDNNQRVNVFTWIWRENTIEDYGLTGYNYTYGMNNVLCTRHTVITDPGQDYLQSSLSVLPPGKNSSIRLGNPRAGGKGSVQKNPTQFMTWHPQAEKIAFDYTVTPDNTLLLFQYAAILDKAEHSESVSSDNPYMHPFIDIMITNTAGTILDEPTTSFTCHGNRTLNTNPEWHSFTRTGGVSSFWKDWSTVGFDLTPYVGQTVRIEVDNYECVSDEMSQQRYNMYFYYCGKHFGYIYFYLDCAPKQLEVECLDNRMARLTAPEGFNYRWYSQSNPSVTLSTQRTADVFADGYTRYCCQLTQKEGMKGSFVLDTIPLCGIEVNLHDTVCAYDLPYTFAGKTITMPGHYADTVHLTADIDSITTLDLVVQSVATETQTASFCASGSYKWKVGSKIRTLTQEGTYKDTIRYESGCDSLYLTLQLTAIEAIHTTDTVFFCAKKLDGMGGGFTWNGIFIGKPTDNGKTKKLTSAAGCDSIVTLYLDMPDLDICFDTIIVPNRNFPELKYGNYNIYYQGSKEATENTYNKLGSNGLPIYKKDTLMGECTTTAYLRLFVIDVKDSVESYTLCDSDLPIAWRGYSINSAADNGKQFIEKSKNGLDSVCYTLDLTVHPTYKLTLTDTICESEPYHFGDTILTTSGTYTRSFVTPFGCDSTITLQLTVQTPKTARTERINICQGEPPFTWEGHGSRFANLTQADTYRDTAFYSTGCDSVYYTLRITTADSSIAHINKLICADESIDFFGVEVKTEGTYRGVTENVAQCDSIIYMHLSILPPCQTINIDTLLCDQSQLTWRGKTLTADGILRDTVQNQLECDSIIYILNAHFLRSSAYAFDTTLCDGETLYLVDTLLSTPGTYTRTLPNVAGCDSVVTVQLYYLPPSLSRTAFICEGNSYPFYDTILTTTGVYYHTIAATDHCQAIETLHLTVGSVVSGDTTITRCYGDSYLFMDTLLTTSGDYQRLIQRSGQGLCDSLAQVHFIVLPKVQESDTAASFCGGQSILWRGRTINTQDQFVEVIPNRLGCDSLVFRLQTTLLTSSFSTVDTTICAGESYTFLDTTLTSSATLTRTLTNAVGCDSLLTLNLTVQHPVQVPTDTVSLPQGATYNWLGHPSFSDLDSTGTYYDTLYYTTGCDSAYTSLYLKVYEAEVKGTFYVDTVCGDDPVLALTFLREQGQPVSYDLTFSGEALKQGFKNVSQQPFNNAAIVEWTEPMPDSTDEQWYVRPDKYDLTLQITDAADRQSSYKASFVVLYPSWVILQRWNDVLTITNSQYNGGYEFTDIQWLFNNEPVQGSGSNNAYYYAGNSRQLQFGVPYKALLTRKDDGKTFATCDYLPIAQYNDTKVDNTIHVVPRLTGSTRQIRVVTHLSGQYSVYDVTGKKVMNGRFGSKYGSPDIIFPAHYVNGTYILRFYPESDDNRSIEDREIHKKWLVY